MKGACTLILDDWTNQPSDRAKLVSGLNASFQKGGVLGYAEMSGDTLILHSERANPMRFHMLLASAILSNIRRAGFTAFTYTNDADQKFIYDVKGGHILFPPEQQSPTATGTVAKTGGAQQP